MGKKDKNIIEQDLPKYLVIGRAIVRDGGGKILLIKRSRGESYYPGKWELPGGKLLNVGDIREAVENGVNRETNLVVEMVSHRFYFHGRNVSEQGKYKDYIYLEVTGEANFLGGSIKLIPGQHDDYSWVALEEVFNFDLAKESKKALTQYISDLRGGIEGQNRLPVLVSARAIITDQKGKYLLIKRAKNDSSFAGFWDLPGGKMSNLEVLEELLKREVFEETGLIVAVDQLVLYMNSQISNQGKYAGFTFINLVSAVHVMAGKIKLSEEHDEYGWFSKEDIFKLNLAPSVKLSLTEILLKI